LPAFQERSPAKEIVQFYLSFLSGVAKRQEDIKGVSLQYEIIKALESIADSLPADDKLLVPTVIWWQLPEPFIFVVDTQKTSERYPMTRIDRVKDFYNQVISELIGRLHGQLDESIVRLLFRLAARDALQHWEYLATRYALFEGIPETYLRQPGPSINIQ
jgi:hypothetical protein